MLIYDDIRFQLNNLKPKLDDLKQALDLDKAQTEIAQLEEKAAQGVEVRVLYDDIGCLLRLPTDYPQNLAAKGSTKPGRRR